MAWHVYGQGEEEALSSNLQLCAQQTHLQALFIGLSSHADTAGRNDCLRGGFGQLGAHYRGGLPSQERWGG